MGIGTGLASAQEGRPVTTVSEASRNFLERETGIEPASLAWKAKVLPLNYSRGLGMALVVEEVGFEPT